MKFFRFYNERLMNEAGDIDSGGAASDSGMSGPDAFAQSSQNSISIEDEDVFKNFGLDAKKYGIEEEAEEGELDEGPQGGGQEEVAGQETDEKSILDVVNSLGLVHNENPFQVESKDELKNLIQMGRDYTVKTQALSSERKEFETQKTAVETELNSAIDEFNAKAAEFDGKLQELEQWSFTLNNLKSTNPDLFQDIIGAHEHTQRQYSNPILDQKLKAISQELAETKKSVTAREHKLIVDGFESEYSKLASLEQSMKELGITVNKEEVKKKWAETGVSPEEAIGMLYGTKAMLAQASKEKKAQTKAKVSVKPVGSAGASRVGSKQKAIDPKLKGMAYAEALWDRY